MPSVFSHKTDSISLICANLRLVVVVITICVSFVNKPPHTQCVLNKLCLRKVDDYNLCVKCGRVWRPLQVESNQLRAAWAS